MKRNREKERMKYEAKGSKRHKVHLTKGVSPSKIMKLIERKTLTKYPQVNREMDETRTHTHTYIHTDRETWRDREREREKERHNHAGEVVRRAFQRYISPIQTLVEVF